MPYIRSEYAYLYGRKRLAKSRRAKWLTSTSANRELSEPPCRFSALTEPPVVANGRREKTVALPDVAFGTGLTMLHLRHEYHWKRFRNIGKATLDAWTTVT